MTVAVESNDLAAWVGVVGVVAGVVASAGVSFLLGIAADRKARRHDLAFALDEARAAATALYMIVATVADTGRPEGLAGLPLAEAISASLERLQKSAETVRRLGPPELGKAARDLVDSLLTRASGTMMGAEANPNAIGQANGEFIRAVRAAGY